MKNQFLFLLIYLSVFAPCFASNTEINLENEQKHKIQYSKPIQKSVENLKLEEDQNKMMSLIEYQKDRDFEDIEALWEATVNNNNLIKFALQKLSSPESQKRIHSSLMNKTLSALITGAAYLPSLMGSNSLIQSASFATGKIAQNFLNRENLPAQSAISDTELIELAGMIEDLQDEIITTYYNYKITLNQIRELREKLFLYNKNYSSALKNKDSLEISISGALYDDILIEEAQLKNNAKNYHLQLQRLAGKDIFKKLNLCQYVYKTEIFEQREIDINQLIENGETKTKKK